MILIFILCSAGATGMTIMFAVTLVHAPVISVLGSILARCRTLFTTATRMILATLVFTIATGMIFMYAATMITAPFISFPGGIHARRRSYFTVVIGQIIMHVDPRAAGELAALVGVEDFRLTMLGEGFFQSLHAEVCPCCSIAAKPALCGCTNP